MFKKICQAGGTKEIKSFMVTIPMKFIRDNNLSLGDIIDVKFELPKYMNKEQLEMVKKIMEKK